jgi:hypothetical protein
MLGIGEAEDQACRKFLFTLSTSVFEEAQICISTDFSEIDPFYVFFKGLV